MPDEHPVKVKNKPGQPDFRISATHPMFTVLLAKDNSIPADVRSSTTITFWFVLVIRKSATSSMERLARRSRRGGGENSARLGRDRADSGADNIHAAEVIGRLKLSPRRQPPQAPLAQATSVVVSLLCRRRYSSTFFG